MPLISWTDALVVGIPAIDEDHQSLVELLNRTYDAVSNGQGREVADEVIERLSQYTETHFAREEELLERHGYPALEEHRAAHNALREQVAAFRAAVQGGTPGSADEVALFLKNWLTRHILNHDHRYAQFLRDKGVV